MQALPILCDAQQFMTHAAEAEAVMSKVAFSASQIRLQLPYVATAVDGVPVLTLLH